MANTGNIATIVGNVLTDSAIDLSTKADLVGGLVPSSQLPSYVDDVLEYATLAGFPATGETGKIYVDLATNKIYRWSGTVYVEVSAQVGTTWGGITGTLSNQTDLQNALNAKQDDLNGTGFVKVVGTTVSYDNSTYLTGITSSQVTTALGFTPYNATNPSGYLTASTVLSTVLTPYAVGANTAVLATDTIETAIEKLQGQVNARQATLGFTPVTNARTLTINGVAFDLTADRSWTIASASSIATLTDVTLTSVADGQQLKYNAATSKWINFTAQSASSVRIENTFTATAGQTTFTIAGGYTPGLVDVFVNGAKYDPSDFTASNGTTVVLGAGLTVGDLVSIIVYVSTLNVLPTARVVQEYTATAAQTTFTVTGGYIAGLLDVFVNGVKLTSSEYTASNGTTFVLTIASVVGDQVQAISYTSSTSGISGSGTSNTLPKFTANGTIGNSSIQESGALITLASGITALRFNDSVANIQYNGNLTIGIPASFTAMSFNSSGNTTINGTLTGTSATFSSSITINGGGSSIRNANELRFYRADNAIYTKMFDSGSLAANGFVLDNMNAEGFHFKNNGVTLMRMNSAGNVGVNTTTPSGRFGVVASGADGVVLEQDTSDANNSARLFFKATGQTYGVFNNASDLRITYGAVPGSTSGTSFAKFANTGKYFRLESGTGGIQFQGATGAGNALNYYEEGTWTPTIDRATGSPTVSYSDRQGTYTRIGNMVYVLFDMTATSITGGSGIALITGLPFTVSNTQGGYGVAQWRDTTAVAAGAANTVLKGFTNKATAYIYLQIDNTGSAGFGNNTSATWNSSGRATGFAMYQV